MKSELLIAGILSTYASGAFATAPSTTNDQICAMFQMQKKAYLIGNYATKLEDGTYFCAQISKTDDQKMLELVLFRKDKTGTINKFGDNVGDDVRLYLLPNPMDTSKDYKAYIGITCNSSEGCSTGETFIAVLEEHSKELYLRLGEHSLNNKDPLAFLPEELKTGLQLFEAK